VSALDNTRERYGLRQNCNVGRQRSRDLSERGARNVWVATAPMWQARQLTRCEGDDGQEIENLTFTPDGRSVVNIAGGVDQAIWIASLDQATPRKIAEGSSPELSPSSGRLPLPDLSAVLQRLDELEERVRALESHEQPRIRETH
jgi:hypothetical protein